MPVYSQISWLLIFTLFALPLVFSPFTYLAFELPKIFLLYLFSAIAICYLLMSGYHLGQLKATHYLYFILFIWIIITALLGLSLPQSLLGNYFRMQGMITWVCYGLLFLVSGKLLEDNHLKKYFSLAILTGSATAATFAIAQFISLWFFGNTSQLLYSNRVISTFGQPNFLGAYLTMSLPFIWFLTKQVTRKWQVLIYFLMILVILGVFSTVSRSAYLGLGVLALIWGSYHYRLLLIATFSSILLFALLANLFPNLVYQQWYRLKVDTDSIWTAENRLVIAQKSIKLIAQKPITGYGLENFPLAFPGIISANDLGLKDIVVDSSHNLFLDLAVQTGLVGLGLFVMILISAVTSGLKNRNAFTTASLNAVVIFLVIHQFSPYSVVPMALFWLSLGIITKSPLQHSILPKITKYIFQLIGITLITITILFEVQTIRAETFFRQASFYEVSDIYKAIDLDNQAIKLAPWIGFYQARKGFLLKQLGL